MDNNKTSTKKIVMRTKALKQQGFSIEYTESKIYQEFGAQSGINRISKLCNGIYKTN